jgi:hypothetical protein
MKLCLSENISQNIILLYKYTWSVMCFKIENFFYMKSVIHVTYERLIKLIYIFHLAVYFFF